MTDATLRQALAFAGRGWPVLPCQPGQKTPATRHGVRDASTDPGRYRPDPVTTWWKLSADGRREPLARLGAWVEQVYRPGYGHLAATLGPCWEAHDLCLYGLDIAAGLWSVLYLQPDRTPGLLSAQAEYQARILPALAEQFRVETSWCAHPHSPAQPRPGSRP